MLTWTSAVVKVDPQGQEIQVPHPAVKCVIGQYLEIFADRSWGWLIVASFYDEKDSELWHIEVILGRKPRTTQSESSQQTLDNNTLDSNTANHQWIDYSPPQQSTAVLPVFNNNIPPQPYINPYSYAMSANIGRGWNPATGWDNGGLPPGTSLGGMGRFATMPGSGYAPGPYADVPLMGINNHYGFAGPYYPQMPGPPGSVGPVYTMPANGFQNPVPVIPGQPGGPRFPGPHPVVNSECPALNLQNSTGGMGCEPGYNYYFPAEHTKIHVIKSREPPWRLPPGMNLQFMAYHVPVQTTLGDLMKGFGATNPSPKKNKITEVVEGGNSRWYKGVTFSGEDKDDMKKTLKDLGWDKTRTGRHGEKPVVWLWVTKD